MNPAGKTVILTDSHPHGANPAFPELCFYSRPGKFRDWNKLVFNIRLTGSAATAAPAVA
jgi:hypothetical protein